MAITAKVRCNNSTAHNEQVQYTFIADYVSAAGKDINAEWAKYTPALNLSITVKPDVPFEVGRAYTLTFDPDGDAPAHDDGG